MNIVCARSIEDIAAGQSVDILVLPEDIPIAAVLAAGARYPTTLIVAAVRDGCHMRGYLMANGINQIDYLKTLDDGRSEPCPEIRELPVYENAAVAVGVLICRDYQNNDLRLPMLERLRNTKAPISLLCVPADMNSDFFADEQTTAFLGVFCALSNNKKTYENPCRCRSFIANRSGAIVSRQLEYEAIVASAA